MAQMHIMYIYGASETQTFYLPHTIAFKVHAPAQQQQGTPRAALGPWIMMEKVTVFQLQTNRT